MKTPFHDNPATAPKPNKDKPMPLWYAETVGMHGRWSPQTTPYQPETISRGGHLREASMGRIGRRIRAIAKVRPEDTELDLTGLQAIYGPDAQGQNNEPEGASNA